jgi:integrase
MPRTKTNRRAAGEGSLFKRQSDGLWRGYITVSSDDGTQKKQWVSSKSQQDAKKKLDDLKDKQSKGTLLSRTKVTLAERINHWLEYEIKTSVAEGTYEKYRTNIRNHINNDTLGKRAIQKITRTDMVEYLAKKEEILSPATVKILLSILHRVFDIALIDDVISKSPLLCVKRSKRVEKKKRRGLTEDEEKTLLETAKNWNYNKQVYNILFMEYGSGLRRSEILPLKWSDINFSNGELQIKRVYVMLRGTPKLEERAKSDASQEAIILPEIILNYFNKFKPEKAEDKDAYMFPARNGDPINPNSFRRTFKRIAEKAGLDKEIRLHDLRHNFASQMVAQNIHISLVQAQMRHADMKTTAIYAHTNMDGQRHAAALINDHLKKLVTSS